MDRYVLTTTPILKKAMILYLNLSSESFTIEKEIKNGIYLVKCSSKNRENQSRRLYESRRFIKHLFKVDKIMKKSANLESDLALLKSYVDTLGINSNDKFSVQVRNINNADYTAKDIEVGLGTYIERKYKATPYFSDTKIPLDVGQRIISVLIFGDKLYMGLGSALENLYPVSDPYRIFSRWKAHISRAEFKLREALQIIGYKPKKGELAVDLGAAPGGWSLVLAELGMDVIAVDPASLDSRLLNIKNITHFKGKSQDFYTDKEIVLLVNDMNLDPKDSAQVILSFAKNLKPKSLVIMTIKLVCGPYQEKIEDVCNILKLDFKLLDIRLLFHNRQEVTTFFEKV